MPKECLNPPTLPKPARPTYSQVVKATGGTLIFISGQASLDRNGNIVGKGDIEKQTRQTLENLKEALNAVGAKLEDVVKITILLTDLRYFDVIHKVRAEYFKEKPPASTLIQVPGLFLPDLLIEIDAIAIKE
jgi:reactive intermediate/imine deaminase